MEGLFEVDDGKYGEYNEGDDLLGHFKLKAVEPIGEAPAVGRHHEAVFEKGYAPAHEDGLPKGEVLLFEVTIPGDGHEYIGQQQQDDGTHS